ncbi:hypothetical protein [Rhizomonospora bruguierae]|uniref:hypothetical protein n=1 Tax=Rhizomonospora bruguierae TaxID=1581705 RepID=UPI0020C09224|nr:hypothetical protein [Micromonospora sp. NBRC 107566]
MGLFIILLLAAATVLLIRNMNARLRRLPERFPAPGGEPGTPEAGVERSGVAAERIDVARSDAAPPAPRSSGDAAAS